jgi:hypothetical protein
MIPVRLLGGHPWGGWVDSLESSFYPLGPLFWGLTFRAVTSMLIPCMYWYWACADSIASSGARKKVSFMHWLLSCDKVLLCSGACGGCVCTQQVSRVAAHEGIKTFQNPRCFGGWIPHAGKFESGTWGLSGPKGCMLSLSSYPYTQTAEVPDSVTGMRKALFACDSHEPPAGQGRLRGSGQNPQSPRAALGPNPGLGAAGNDTMRRLGCCSFDLILPSASLLSRAVGISDCALLFGVLRAPDKHYRIIISSSV